MRNDDDDADEGNEDDEDAIEELTYSTSDLLEAEIGGIELTDVATATDDIAAASRKFIVRRMKRGQNITLWTGVNVNGRVFYKIGNRSGTNKLRLWWVNKPIGNIDKVGTRRDSGEVKIPRGFLKIVNLLRAGHADSDTVIYISEDIRIAQNFPKIKF